METTTINNHLDEDGEVVDVFSSPISVNIINNNSSGIPVDTPIKTHCNLSSIYLGDETLIPVVAGFLYHRADRSSSVSKLEYRKRWFCLENNYLTYFKSMSEASNPAFAIGSINLRNALGKYYKSCGDDSTSCIKGSQVDDLLVVFNIIVDSISCLSSLHELNYNCIRSRQRSD